MSKYQVPSLHTLSLRGVGSFVEKMTLDIISKSKTDGREARGIFGGYGSLQEPIPRQQPPPIDERTQTSLDGLLKLLTSYIPPSLYNEVAQEVLRFVERRAEKIPSSKEEAVLQRIMEAVLNPELRSIDFREWKSIEISLYENLHNLSGLENLILSLNTRRFMSTEFDQYLLESISMMKNLKSFTFRDACKDVLVETIVDYCPAIQCLNLSLSLYVTNLSIPHLLKCQNLRELKLIGTGITNDGLAQLIVGLPNLQIFEFCCDFEAVVNYCFGHYPTFSPFEIRNIFSLNVSDKWRRIHDMFPEVEWSTLTGQQPIVAGLMNVENIVYLKLLFRMYLGGPFRQLLEVKGGNITGLCLENVKNICFQDIVNIGRYCPNLKFLKLIQSDYGNSPNSLCRPYRFNTLPFSNLETVIWKGNLLYLRFVLIYAVNIRCIHVDSPIRHYFFEKVHVDKLVTHGFFEKVLSVNSMRQLEELYIPSTSLFNSCTAELLLDKCKNLRIVSKVKSCQALEQTYKSLAKHRLRN